MLPKLSQFLRHVQSQTHRFLLSLDRVGYLIAAFFLFAAFILWTTFRYTVIEYDYYKTLADKQQTITVKNPVSRGTIYSNNDPAGVFATSTDLPDLAVDPKSSGSKDKLIPFLADIVYLDLCGRDGYVD